MNTFTLIVKFVFTISARRLYWVDSFMHQISSANFDGSDRQLFIEERGVDFIDLDIDLNYIYFIGGNRQYVVVDFINTNKFDNLIQNHFQIIYQIDMKEEENVLFEFCHSFVMLFPY